MVTKTPTNFTVTVKTFPWIHLQSRKIWNGKLMLIKEKTYSLTTVFRKSRKEQVTISWLCIGITKLMHSFILKQGLVWFNHCKLFNAKFSLYINVKYIWFVNISQTRLNGSKYCYVSETIQLNISHLFTHS